MLSFSERVESETISGFDFPLPEEMPFSLHPAQVDWWKTHYRQAVIALRTREAELAASRLLHQKALQREEQLQQKIEELKAKLRQREKELFARRSEASPSKNESLKEASPPQRRRGQQKGNPGPKRRDHSHLPQKEEFVELAEDQKCCATCGLAFDEFASTEDSEEIGVEVKAHVRKIRRKRYRKTCHCPSTPTIITAPPPRKLLPKAKLGISVWVEVILSKYWSHQPTYRFIRQWEAQGLFLSQATLTDGLKRLLPLLLPLYEVMVKKQLNDTHWHADETRWMVFESLEGKSSYRWYLWVVHSSSAVIFVLDPSRSAQVIKDHFSPQAQGILSVDRYSAYKAMAKVLQIGLAFCWAHVRRDFLKVASSWPQYESWAFNWIEKIGHLYHLNKTRLQLAPETPEYNAADFELRKAVQQMEKQCQRQLKQETLASIQQAVLNSLNNHWEGLTLFVKFPHIPMDNNIAERDMRGPAVGRKNYYGSGAIWSGMLATISFSLIQTLLSGNINPYPWFSHYFEACAQAEGNVPHNYKDFLPWNLSAEQKEKWAFKPIYNDTS